MKVRAKERGFYGDSIIEEGEVFDIKSKKELGDWMEPVRVTKPDEKPAK